MPTEIISTSKWEYPLTGQTCRVISKREAGSAISEFHIEGYNPLPCLTFKGTYTVLANWLKANGWRKIIKTDIYAPDVVVIHHK